MNKKTEQIESLKSKIIFLLSEHKISLLIFTIALVLRVIFLFAMFTETAPGNISELIHDTIKYVDAFNYLFGHSEAGQFELYLVGLGYPLFLGLYSSIFGQVIWPVLLIQIILGSFSCVILYKTANLIMNNRIIAAITGLLPAVSLTAISLTNAVLTETLFFFLFSLSLYYLFKGLKENRWSTVIASGILCGLAVLVRSVIMFFPIIIIFIGFVYPLANSLASRKHLIIKAVSAALIMILISSMWGFRNYKAHDTFTLSGTGSGAARLYLASQVILIGEGRSPDEFRYFRDSLYQASLSDFHTGNYKKNQRESYELLISTIKARPVLFTRVYLSNIWDNITAVSSIQYLQLPQYTKYFDLLGRLNWDYYNPLVLILSLGGLIVISRKNKYLALIFLSIMAYFAVLSGVTLGQGSRIFYPVMTVQSILVAIALLFIYDLVILGKNLLFKKKQI